MPASSPALASSSSTLKPRALGPAHHHPQHHLGPVLGVGAARAGVDGDERVARVVGPGEQPLLLERGEALLDRGELLLELGGHVRILLGELDEPLEVVDVGLQRGERLDLPVVRACSAETLAAVLWSSQKPGSPIWPSSSATCRLSAAGSKVVREQLELVADRRKALRRRL